MEKASALIDCDDKFILHSLFKAVICKPLVVQTTVKLMSWFFLLLVCSENVMDSTGNETTNLLFPEIILENRKHRCYLLNGCKESFSNLINALFLRFH